MEPVLPKVQDRIWSDLLLAALWDRVLETKAQRMLFRMTLLPHPWDDGLLRHLGDPEDAPEVIRRTADTLAATSLLERIDLTVKSRDGRSRHPFYTIHAATAAFVRSRYGDSLELAIATHRRIGSYLEERTRTSSELSLDLWAGYHLFEAGEYARAFELVGSAATTLRRWGRVRESLRLLSPYLTERVRRQLPAKTVCEVLGEVGLGYASLSEARLAIEHYDQALVISREIRERLIEANLLGNLGLVYAVLGETHRAIEQYEQTLIIAREIGNRLSEGNTLGNLGLAYAELGETRRASELYEQQLAIVREIKDRRGEANALGNLGNAHAVLGKTRRAIELYEQQLVIVREIKDRRGEGNAVGSLGIAFQRLGELSGAIDFYQQRLVIAREIGDRRGEATGLANLASAYVHAGELSRAVDYYTQALAIGRAVADPRIVSSCEEALKHCAADLNRSQQAARPEPKGRQEQQWALTNVLTWARKTAAKLRRVMSSRAE